MNVMVWNMCNVKSYSKWNFVVDANITTFSYESKGVITNITDKNECTNFDDQNYSWVIFCACNK